jgi:hypothetical protein
MYIIDYTNPINGMPQRFTFRNEDEARQVFTQLWVDWHRYTHTTIFIDQTVLPPTMHTGEPE